MSDLGLAAEVGRGGDQRKGHGPHPRRTAVPLVTTPVASDDGHRVHPVKITLRCGLSRVMNHPSPG